MTKRLLLCFAAAFCICTGTQAAKATKTVWAPKGELIKTKWASEVNPAAPLPEYPRPQMVRQNWMNLNGLWDYAIIPDSEGYTKADGKILVPFCAESSLSGVQKEVGRDNALWYERTFKLPREWRAGKVLLNFGAVDWKTEVWVNGIKVCEHTGGYTPFSADITAALTKKSEQTIRIKVWDATDYNYQPRGKQVQSPQGIWYTPVTGIWQTVWLESVGSSRIDSYLPVWDAKSGTLNVQVNATGINATDCIKVELLEGAIGYSAEAPAQNVLSAAEAINGTALIKVDAPNLWSPDSPYLYGLCITVSRDGKVLDRVQGYTALRTVGKVKDPQKDPKRRREISYNRFALNGERIFHFGPLDQGWWPDGLYTAPTDEALRFDVAKTREWGWNMIRKHIKVEPARWYYWCDVLGVMVWQDMPCIADHSKKVLSFRAPDVQKNTANVWSGDSFLNGTDCHIPQPWKDNYYKEWSEIIDALKIFQCIVVWVPFNEAWGQFDTPKVVEFTRAKDATRLINESSGGNFCLKGDVLDAHHYSAPAMNVFEGRKINVIGEYGGLGHVVKGHLWKPESDNWGYGGTIATPEEVLETYALYADMLKTFIKTGVTGAVYTQTTDVEIEVNGIMTYDRIPKIDEKEFAKINRGVIEALK